MNRLVFIIGVITMSSGCVQRAVTPTTTTQINQQVKSPPAFRAEDNEVCNQIENNLRNSAVSLKQCVSSNTVKFKNKTKNTDDIVTAVSYSCDKEITDFSIKSEGNSLCDLARKKGQSFMYTMNYFNGMLPSREEQKAAVIKTIRPQIITNAIK
ncbi:hypothetical protein AAHE14_00690 [Raoultella ornithinolytica]|jgi:hypothetical protein|uniref:hypothetical protein n=1 Tax=Raoultella ornithinolytica TaxID=54291 RepID=UPI00396785CA